jgi:uncharacterized DUF497 family protein
LAVDHDDKRHTQDYHYGSVKTYRWNEKKNEQLKRTRGISFEDIVLAIESDGLLDVVTHPNSRRYPNQKILVVAVMEYVYLVPHVEEPDYLFLKTIIPSRKATRDYERKGEK